MAAAKAGATREDRSATVVQAAIRGKNDRASAKGQEAAQKVAAQKSTAAAGKKKDAQAKAAAAAAERQLLAENTFARDGLVDLSGPVIRLASLTPEDLFVLLANIRAVMQGDEAILPDNALEAFMAHCSDRIGEAYFRTPRNTVTAFVNLLAVLEQNPGVEWSDLIEELDVAEDSGDDMSDVDESVGAVPESDELASFRL